jgi:hypothetical protein
MAKIIKPIIDHLGAAVNVHDNTQCLLVSCEFFFSMVIPRGKTLLLDRKNPIFSDYLKKSKIGKKSDF